MRRSKQKQTNGRITQIIGPVIDAIFPIGTLPNIYNSLQDAHTLDKAREVVYHMSPEQLNQSFNQAIQMLGLSEFNIVRYSWRHAAASHDLLSKFRTAEEVKSRYRWKSDSSMKRYTKAARVEFFRSKLPNAVLEFGSTVKTQLPAMFAGLRIKPPLQ